MSDKTLTPMTKQISLNTKVKLTPKQKQVIKDLQGESVLITGSGASGALVGGKDSEYRISNGVFWRLVDKGLIYQQIEKPFNYILTDFGKQIKL